MITPFLYHWLPAAEDELSTAFSPAQIVNGPAGFIVTGDWLITDIFTGCELKLHDPTFVFTVNAPDALAL
jgi:hypothetical protein